MHLVPRALVGWLDNVEKKTVICMYIYYKYKSARLSFVFLFSRNNSYIYIYIYQRIYIYIYTHEIPWNLIRYPWRLVNAKLHAPVSVANFSPGSLMFWRGATKHTQGCDTRRTQGPHMVFCENFGKHLVNLPGYYHCYHINLQLCGVPKFQTHPHGTWTF